MAKQTQVDKLLEHPDKDELIAKLINDTTPKQINEWLKVKYSTVGESKLVLSEKYLKDFKDEYLDLYQKIKEDIYNTKFSKASADEKVNLVLTNNSAYKKRILELADGKIDMERMITNLILNIEDRVAILFDTMREDPDKFRNDRALVEWCNSLGDMVERLYNMQRQDRIDVEATQNITNNTQINIQILDEHVTSFYDVFRDTLKELDMEQSMKVMDIFNSKLNKIKEIKNKKELSVDQHLAEVKLLSENVQKKLNG